MKIIECREEHILRIALEGNLDAVTTPQFQTMLRTSLDGITEVVLDMDNLVYISSAGLRILYAVRNLMDKVDGKFLICNVQPDIQEVFDVTGLSGILTII